jgi:predicted AAA+ superfamily ATPase
MDRQVKESLAGRASYYQLNTLTVAEILESLPSLSIQHILFSGGWPELYAQPEIQPSRYLDNFINSYVERDIVLTAGIQKSREFLRFLRLLAGRVGQRLNLSSLGNDAGIDSKTAKEWISILERMHILALVQPYANSLSKRLIKTPKLYFLDTGLACRLQGWSSMEPLLTSPAQGGLFENLVYCELHKMNTNHLLGWNIYYLASREGAEIDFLVQKSPTEAVVIEAKVSATARMHDWKQNPEFKKVLRDFSIATYLCHQEGDRTLGNNVPIRYLRNQLLEQP